MSKIRYCHVFCITLTASHDIQVTAAAAKMLSSVVLLLGFVLALEHCIQLLITAFSFCLLARLTSSVVLQFVATLTANIEKLSGSPVTVTVDSVTAGSVKIATTVAFLSGDSSSASTYTSVLKSGDVSSVFGTSFGGVAVDASSVKSATVTNPSASEL